MELSIWLVGDALFFWGVGGVVGFFSFPSLVSVILEHPYFLVRHLWLWIVASVWILNGVTAGSRWNDLIVGVLVVALSLPRGSVRERYGGWDRWIV